MSTPSPQPLDYDLVSPYAPKYARDTLPPPPPPPPPPPVEEASTSPQRPRPPAIENDNDAKILDEIETSLRAMLAAEHGAPKTEAPSEQEASRDDAEVPALEEEIPPHEPMARTIDALEVPALADDRQSQERRYYEAMRVQEVLQQVSQHLTQRSPQEASPEAPYAEPQPEPDQPAEEFRLPPAFLARSMEPIQYDEPWPKTRSKPRSSATTLFVRFGFAAGGAAAVMALAVPDLRARFLDALSTPATILSSNASAVFGEGRPATAKNDSARSAPATTIAVRTEPIVLAKEEAERIGAAMPKLATANLSPVLPEQRSGVNSENVPQQRETVMLPSAPQRAAPEAPARSQQIWHGPPGRAEGESPSTTGIASRPLAAEEIDLLRKMASDFIAAGDYAGARGVLERAAEAGDATSALQLATTYDPAALARFKVKGLAADNAKAAFWYERARDLGSQEAPVRLKAMARSN